jgi:hypothetical protein
MKKEIETRNLKHKNQTENPGFPTTTPYFTGILLKNLRCHMRQSSDWTTS